MIVGKSLSPLFREASIEKKKKEAPRFSPSSCSARDWARADLPAPAPPCNQKREDEKLLGFGVIGRPELFGLGEGVGVGAGVDSTQSRSFLRIFSRVDSAHLGGL